MGGLDQQFMVAKESVYGTPVTVTRGFGYDGDPMPIKPVFARTEGNPIRPGSRFRQGSRFVPYFDHAEGHVDLEVMNKGFGFWLEHMLGTVATTGVGPFVHTGTEGTTSALVGKGITAQFNAPFSPAQTNQAFTFGGGKVTKWSLGNTVDQMLLLGLDLWFNQYSTATALATYSEPATMTNFAWTHGVITVAGSAFDITNFNLEVDNGYNLDRKQIRGNSAAKEPVPGVASGTWALEADFDTLAQFTRVAATAAATASVQVIATWTNGADIVTVTVPVARFDGFEFGGDRGSSTQSLSGVVEWNGTNSPVTVAYTTADTTP